MYWDSSDPVDELDVADLLRRYSSDFELDEEPLPELADLGNADEHDFEPL
jgi:hypothetical protein